MRRRRDDTHQKIIDAAYESFWRAGFRRTNVATIAARAGITKRSLYAHFRSKDDLLAEVLSRYEELARKRLQRIGEHMPATANGMIDSLFVQMKKWAAATPRWSGSGLTRLVVELAELPGHPARALARRAKSTTEAWLCDRLAACGVASPAERARETMLLMEGSLALTLIHGDRGYFEAASEAAKRLARPQKARTSRTRVRRLGQA